MSADHRAPPDPPTHTRPSENIESAHWWEWLILATGLVGMLGLLVYGWVLLR